MRGLPLLTLKSSGTEVEEGSSVLLAAKSSEWRCMRGLALKSSGVEEGHVEIEGYRGRGGVVRSPCVEIEANGGA